MFKILHSCKKSSLFSSSFCKNNDLFVTKSQISWSIVLCLSRVLSDILKITSTSFSRFVYSLSLYYQNTEFNFWSKRTCNQYKFEFYLMEFKSNLISNKHFIQQQTYNFQLCINYLNPKKNQETRNPIINPDSCRCFLFFDKFPIPIQVLSSILCNWKAPNFMGGPSVAHMVAPHATVSFLLRNVKKL